MRIPRSLVVLMTMLLLSSAQAETARFALVIGNADYAGAAALANPANDASDVAAALTSVGWTVTTLLNGDRKAMNRSLFEFRDLLRAAENPVALFYYAGHGLQISGLNYLLPVGENFETADEVLSDAISLPSVLALFDEGRVSVSVVILDACRDNPFVKKSTRSVGATRGLTVVQQSSTVEGSAVLFSTAPGDTAADGDGRNGIFTQALLKYLTTSLKLQDLATRVTGEVKRLTGGKQVPFNSISLSEDFYLVPAALRGPEPLSPAVLNAAALAPVKPLSVKNSGLSPLWKASLGWGSLAAGTLGVGLSSLGYWTVAQARLDYSAATVLSSQVGWDAANVVRGRGNLEFNAGFGLVAAALVAWLTPGALSFFAKVAP